VVAASRKIQKQLRDFGFSSVIIPSDLSQNLERLSLTSLTANLESAEDSPKEHPSGDIEVIFDDALSADQVLSTLTAMADYYRACGGVGLSAEFEAQECVTEGVHA
jgi:hypothetical protein